VKQIWIIERSVNGGAEWLPVTALGVKLKRVTAERLAAKNNEFYTKYCSPPISSWRDRATAYSPATPEATA
jgi:hypothetical protein